MANRIMRGELLESEAWLSLKDNSDRVAWIAVALTVDNFGDMPAGPQRLIKLWRPYGIETPENVAKVTADLVSVDLIRMYEHGGKTYLHVPRFNQRCRHLGLAWPLSPWATNEQKQMLGEKWSANGGQRSAEVDVEVKKRTKTLAQTPNGFERFWEAYPRKKGKKATLTAWAKLKPDEPLQSTLFAALAVAKNTDEWARADGRYIPYPASWLNGRRWEDEIETAGEKRRKVE